MAAETTSAGRHWETQKTIQYLQANSRGYFTSKKGPEGEGVDAGAIEAADGAAGIGDQGLAEKVERGVDENGRGRRFAEFVQQLPENGVGVLLDGVHAHQVSVEGEAFEAADGIGERGQRSHEAAIRRSVEILGGALGGNGKRERMEFLAMLDVFVDVFDDVFGKRRGQQAAVAEGAVAEFRAALAPGDDFVAQKKPCGFLDGLFFPGKIAINDFAVVENGFHFLGAGVQAHREARKRRAAGVPGDFLAGKIRGAEGRAGIAGDGLHVDALERTAGFEGVDQKNIQENAAGQAERARIGALGEIAGKLQNDLLEKILGAAGEIGAHDGARRMAARRKPKFAIKLRRKNPAMVGTGGKVAAV